MFWQHLGIHASKGALWKDLAPADRAAIDAQYAASDPGTLRPAPFYRWALAPGVFVPMVRPAQPEGQRVDMSLSAPARRAHAEHLELGRQLGMTPAEAVQVANPRLKELALAALLKG